MAALFWLLLIGFCDNVSVWEYQTNHIEESRENPSSTQIIPSGASMLHNRSKRSIMWNPQYSCDTSIPKPIQLGRTNVSPRSTSQSVCETKCIIIAKPYCFSYQLVITAAKYTDCYLFSVDCLIYAPPVLNPNVTVVRIFARCPDLPYLNNTMQTLPPPYRENDTITVLCNSGTFTDGSSVTATNYTCLTNGTWDSILKPCYPKKDYCQPNPCRNGGKCELSDKTNFTCACVKQWEGQICDKFGWPKDPLGVVALVSQTIGCTTVVVLLSITVVAYLVARDFSPQPLMILLSDFSALTAHIFVLFCRYPFLANLTVVQCKFVAFAIQLSMLTSWNFLFMQTCQAFAIIIGVITKGHWPFTKAWQIVLFGFGLPIFLLIISFSINFDQFVTPWTCLVNYGNSSNRIFLLTATAMGSLIMIFAESAGTFERNQLGKKGKGRAARLLLAVDRVQLATGKLGLRSSVMAFLLSFSSFFLASMAIYNFDSYLFPSAFITHIASGIVTFFFHSVEHPKIWAILTRWAKYLFSSCLRNEFENDKATQTVELTEHIQNQP